MIRVLTFCLMLIPCFVNGQGHNKIEALVLGTFHFGETPDFRSSNYDDVLKPKRQREIMQVVKKLAAYKPDKIFVENTPEAQAFWNNVYREYHQRILPSSKTVLQNEIFQIGIRTASLLKLPSGVICINYMNDAQKKASSVEKKWLDFTEEVNNKKPDFNSFFKSNSLASTNFKNYLEEHESWKNLRLKDHLVKMNEEESLRNLQYFNVLAWMDNNTNGVGAELASMEYFRNLKIVQNLYKKLDNGDDRILIIFGAAHAQILSDILKSHPVFTLVPVSEVLK
ncbi:DUF5694 domain-containing protein [Arcticibacterium luteifluviistationis]|nr:DUF5694 domain-containing protein [Arcticibacterium luteifluviistationis]